MCGALAIAAARAATQCASNRARGKQHAHINTTHNNASTPPTTSNPIHINTAITHHNITNSRLYARYFGGDLQLISMEGYGTDAYLHLSKLGNVQEPLP